MTMIQARARDHQPVNVWPAVTDAILLIGSIFIVLSVIMLVTLATKTLPKSGEVNGEAMLSLTYKIPAGIVFTSGSATPLPASRAVLDDILKDVPNRLGKIHAYARSQGWSGYYVILEAAGHTDSDQAPSALFPGGDGNWDLSSARANAVIHVVEDRLRANPALMQSLGVAINPETQQAPNTSTILRASGYGSHLPARPYEGLSDTSLQDAKDFNRRVEIRLYAEPASLLRTHYDSP